MKRTAPGIFRRLASMLYESLLLLGVLSITFILPHVLLGVFAHINAGKTATWTHLFLLLLLYFLWFWLHGGQTLAMKTWRLKIESADGQVLRPAQALLRYLAAWPSFCFCGLGLLWALFDRDRQFLHDRLAGTRIVHLPKQAPAATGSG